jgi:hypothetical protein
MTIKGKMGYPELSFEKSCESKIIIVNTMNVVNKT